MDVLRTHSLLICIKHSGDDASKEVETCLDLLLSKKERKLKCSLCDIERHALQMWSPVETCCHTGTHGRGSEGETGE